MKCKSCGANLKKDTQFCGNCGCEITKDNKNLTKRARAIIACACCVVILITGTIGGLYFKNSDGNKSESNNNYVALEAGFTDIKVTDEKSALEAIDSVKDVIGIDDVNSELKTERVDEIYNTTYYLFQQYYNDIPVYGKSVNLPVYADGQVAGLTSNFCVLNTDLSTEATVSKSDVEKSLKKHFENQKFIIEDLDSSKLVYFLTDDSKTILTYKLLNTVPGYIVFVNANKGNIVHSNNLFCYDSAEVQSEDGKVKAIGWKNDDGSYHLYNDEHKISIFDYSQLTESKEDEWNFKNLGIDTMYSNTKVFNEKGVKLLSYLCQFDDYFQSLGDKGFDQIHAAINDDIGTNARADGYTEKSQETVRIGALFIGKERNIDDIDIVAHEYTHMVSKSINRWEGKEASALNEAYSDIFGEIIESYIKGNCDWKHDERNIADPENKNNKQYYPSSVKYLENAKKEEENYFISGNSLFGGQVEDYSHFASVIISHCAYLMNTGINGSDSDRINVNKLGELWYNALFLMQTDSTFEQCRNAVELSARIMLNNKELTVEQYNCVNEAFNAVGIEKNCYTYKSTVKNDFDLKVLNLKETDNLTVDYEIYDFSDTSKKFAKIFNLIKKDYEDFKIDEGTLTKGTKSFSLADGLYVIKLSGNVTNGQVEPIMCKIIVDGSNKNSVDEVVLKTDFDEIITVVLNETTTQKPKINNESAYKEYAKIYNNLLKKYGKMRADSKYDNRFYIGINYAELIDFNNDGIDELYVIYAEESEYTPQYTFEVWGYKGDTVQKLDYGEPYGSDGGVKHVAVSEHYGQKYVLTGGDDSFCFSYFHGFNKDDFNIVKSLEAEFDEAKYSIDGKACSEKEYNKAYEEWGKNTKWYALYDNYIDEVIDIINKTEKTLGISNDEIGERDTVSNNDNTDQFYGKETAEQLRKSIIGSWGALGSIVPEYNFIDEKNCSGDMPWRSSGTYSIGNDKSLTIKWDGKSKAEEYIWSTETWDEFYSHHKHEENVGFWCITADGILKLNGKEKYREGVDSFSYNKDGDLIDIISGTWISKNNHTEYKISSDGTWEENSVSISLGTVVSRAQRDAGKVEIVDDKTAKLWQEVTSNSQIPGASELIYDKKTDTISIGGKNNTFSRANY